MAEALKHRYNETYIDRLANVILALCPSFSAAAFRQRIFDHTWPDLELKQRMKHIRSSLNLCLPGTYAEKLALLEPVSTQFSGFEAMFFPDFVEAYGLDDWHHSIPALAHFTQYSSSEFAVRPFIVQEPKPMMAQMLAWAAHENVHVRRLASEGCRPRLPWAMALPILKQDPSPIIPILEKLKNDPEPYVRQSVANNLNDISKDHPQLVLKLAAAWHGTCPERVIKHGCRSLLKAGNRDAMNLFGFGLPAGVSVTQLELKSQQLTIGDTLAFQFKLNTKTPVDLRLEYEIEYAKAHGKRSKKIFKISEKNYTPGSHTVTRKQKFADLTTRKHYPGQHHLRIIVNGETMISHEFQLQQ